MITICRINTSRDALNAKQLLPEMTQALEKAGITLSPKAKVSVEQRHERWLIRDGLNTYVCLGESGLVTVYRTVKRVRNSLSSAYKAVYFSLFVLTAYSVINGFKQSAWNVWPTLGISSPWNATMFKWMVVAFGVAFGLHLLRIYVSLEKLEDPSSEMHRIYIENLGSIKRVLEQILRITVILVVTLHFVGGLNTIHEVAVYLAVLYGALWAWDFFMLAVARRGFRQVFVLSSSCGLVLSCCLAYVTDSEKALLQQSIVLSNTARTVSEVAGKEFQGNEELVKQAEELSGKANDFRVSTLEACKKDDALSNCAVAIVQVFTAMVVFLSVAQLIELILRKRALIRFICDLFRGLFKPYYGEDCLPDTCLKT